MATERVLEFRDTQELSEKLSTMGRIDLAQWRKANDGRSGIQVLYDEIVINKESQLFVVGEGDNQDVLRRVQTTAAGVLYQDLRLTEKAPDGNRIKLISAGVGVMGKVPIGVSSHDQIKQEVWEEMQAIVDLDWLIAYSFVRLEDRQINVEGEFRLAFTSKTYPGLRGENLFHFYRVTLTEEQFLPEGYFHFTSKHDARFLIWEKNKFGNVGVNKTLLGKD
jgi:hypothetical protein